jgi:hypothetical protein
MKVHARFVLLSYYLVAMLDAAYRNQGGHCVCPFLLYCPLSPYLDPPELTAQEARCQQMFHRFHLLVHEISKFFEETTSKKEI